jgi:zinc transporter 2
MNGAKLIVLRTTQSTIGYRVIHQKMAVETLVESEDAAKLGRRQVLRRLQTATALCLIFMVVEVVGGLIAGSLAILSDAAHLSADLASFAVAIAANYLASLPSSSQHTYGLQRTESLAALFSMVSLVLICVGLSVEAFRRLWRMLVEGSSEEVDGRLMSGLATIGVFVNLALGYVLGEDHGHLPGADGDSHDHSHGDHSHENGKADGHSHDHGPSEEDPLLDHRSSDFLVVHSDEVPPLPYGDDVVTKRHVNLEAAYLHVLGDLAQSVAVLIAGLIIWWKPEYAIVDPLCTLAFCILVFYSTLGVLNASVAVLLEEVPPKISWQAVYDEILALPNITAVHDLHIWSISHGIPCVSVHCSAVGDANCTQALKDVNLVCRSHGIAHITVQMQPASETVCLTCGDTLSHPCK